ncbi:DMT family transporter [Glycomyces algeriensis]|uniref:Multidrug transporter n=1 Tax=Glycomyces algeriensis TaxID=256037 RepID=A0A9W6LJ81_9ACTN|nr:DMT family transporter [Glycomyces algeriensis]MDA1367865.1 DMT family transporter [Glycomyces algeriensis]MDR7352012.1 drug/metabolite transporter (DMT)-like permease [Glycomyces algeriensis]GLI44744.1 multidrug transporter [Glycomyces algeriensis]
MSPRLAGTARVAALALLWGSGFLWIKIGLEGFTPIQITLFRMALGAAVLLVILRLSGLSLPRDRKTWGHLTVAAFFGNALPYLLFGIGEQTVSSTTAGVINASTPLWTVLITVLAYRNGTSARRNAWSLIIGFAGVLLIFSPWNHTSEIASWGGLACLGAAASYGVSYVYIGKFLVKKDLGVLRMATGQLISATALTLAMIPLFGWTQPSWEPIPILAVLILGTLGTGIAYILNYRIITDDGPTAASIVVYLLPVVAVALGIAVLREVLESQTIAGTALVLLAAHLRKPEPSQQLTHRKPV